MTDLKDKVLGQISEEKLTPKPRWHFVLRNSLVWFSGIAFLVIGAIAISVMIFVVQNGAWEVREALGNSRFGHMLKVFPLLWLIAFVLFVSITKWAISHTKRGYRYGLTVIVPVIFFASIALGFTLNMVGMSKHVDDELGHRVPGYKTLEHRRDNLMDKPQIGRITGVIRERGEMYFVLENKKKGTRWEVDAENVPPKKQRLIVVGQAVLVVGEIEGEEEFEAIDIHPLAAVKERLLQIKKGKSVDADVRKPGQSLQPVK